jgi:hypothetical protein
MREFLRNIIFGREMASDKPARLYMYEVEYKSHYSCKSTLKLLVEAVDESDAIAKVRLVHYLGDHFVVCAVVQKSEFIR